MIRRAAALVIALTINPVALHAQDTVLTVNVPSADVHKGPSTVTPIIGHVSRGAVLPVARNLGSWVKIAWPTAPDGIGYVHVTMGRVGPPSPEAAANPMTRPAAPAPVTTTPAAMTRTSVGEPVMLRKQLNIPPASHVFGVGGLVAPMNSFGGTARAWRGNHLGVQFGFTRETTTSEIAAGRATSMQFEPGVVYALFDRVSDYVWVRPYVGSVLTLRHQTLSNAAPLAAEPMSDNSVGFRAFGGTELTFAAVPRFGLSADVGYRRLPTAFAGFEADRLSLSIAGHWYVK